MKLGVLDNRTLEHLKIPLSEQEEAILALMKRINSLEYEISILKQQINGTPSRYEEHY